MPIRVRGSYRSACAPGCRFRLPLRAGPPSTRSQLAGCPGLNGRDPADKSSDRLCQTIGEDSVVRQEYPATRRLRREPGDGGPSPRPIQPTKTARRWLIPPGARARTVSAASASSGTSAAGPRPCRTRRAPQPPNQAGGTSHRPGHARQGRGTGQTVARPPHGRQLAGPVAARRGGGRTSNRRCGRPCAARTPRRSAGIPRLPPVEQPSPLSPPAPIPRALRERPLYAVTCQAVCAGRGG